MNPFQDDYHPGLTAEEAMQIKLAVLNSSFWARQPKRIEDDRTDNQEEK